jgi:UPF0755 protein
MLRFSLIKKLSLLFSGLILLAGLFAVYAYRHIRQPIEHNKAGAYINIPKGSSTQEVLAKLNSEGVLKDSLITHLYIKLNRLGPKLKAGDYRFPSPITPLQVLESLQTGQQRNIRLTILEGWTRWDIANAISKLPEIKNNLSSQDILALMNDTGKINKLDPLAANLEGFLYPDTYFLPFEASPKSIINTLTDKSVNYWTEEKISEARRLNLSVRQIITIASLIETEAKLAEERPLIASVIYNRLKINMPLGIDSAVIYASKLAGKWKNDGKVYKSDLERQSPYNTRINKGLPPGPIASPSAGSLNAALKPAFTSHLYYVRDPDRNDGKHDFYDNETDFYKGVQKLRDWEQRRQNQ